MEFVKTATWLTIGMLVTSGLSKGQEKDKNILKQGYPTTTENSIKEMNSPSDEERETERCMYFRMPVRAPIKVRTKDRMKKKQYKIENDEVEKERLFENENGTLEEREKFIQNTTPSKESTQEGYLGTLGYSNQEKDALQGVYSTSKGHSIPTIYEGKGKTQPQVHDTRYVEFKPEGHEITGKRSTPEENGRTEEKYNSKGSWANSKPLVNPWPGGYDGAGYSNPLVYEGKERESTLEGYEKAEAESMSGGYETKQFVYKPEGYETTREELTLGESERTEEKHKPKDIWKYSKPLVNQWLRNYEGAGYPNPSVYDGKERESTLEGYEKAEAESMPDGYETKQFVYQPEGYKTKEIDNKSKVHEATVVESNAGGNDETEVDYKPEIYEAMGVELNTGGNRTIEYKQEGYETTREELTLGENERTEEKHESKGVWEYSKPLVNQWLIGYDGAGYSNPLVYEGKERDSKLEGGRDETKQFEFTPEGYKTKKVKYKSGHETMVVESNTGENKTIEFGYKPKRYETMGVNTEGNRTIEYKPGGYETTGKELTPRENERTEKHKSKDIREYSKQLVNQWLREYDGTGYSNPSVYKVKERESELEGYDKAEEKSMPGGYENKQFVFKPEGYKTKDLEYKSKGHETTVVESNTGEDDTIEVAYKPESYETMGVESNTGGNRSIKFKTEEYETSREELTRGQNEKREEKHKSTGIWAFSKPLMNQWPVGYDGAGYSNPLAYEGKERESKLEEYEKAEGASIPGRYETKQFEYEPERHETTAVESNTGEDDTIEVDYKPEKYETMRVESNTGGNRTIEYKGYETTREELTLGEKERTDEKHKSTGLWEYSKPLVNQWLIGYDGAGNSNPLVHEGKERDSKIEGGRDETKQIEFKPEIYTTKEVEYKSGHETTVVDSNTREEKSIEVGYKPERYETMGENTGGNRMLEYKPEVYETTREELTQAENERTGEKHESKDIWAYPKPLVNRWLKAYDGTGYSNPSVYEGEKGECKIEGHEIAEAESMPGGYEKKQIENRSEGHEATVVESNTGRNRRIEYKRGGSETTEKELTPRKNERTEKNKSKDIMEYSKQLVNQWLKGYDEAGYSNPLVYAGKERESKLEGYDKAEGESMPGGYENKQFVFKPEGYKTKDLDYKSKGHETTVVESNTGEDKATEFGYKPERYETMGVNTAENRTIEYKPESYETTGKALTPRENERTEEKHNSKDIWPYSKPLVNPFPGVYDRAGYSNPAVYEGKERESKLEGYEVAAGEGHETTVVESNTGGNRNRKSNTGEESNLRVREITEEKPKPRYPLEYSNPLVNKLLRRYDRVEDSNPSVYEGKKEETESVGYERVEFEYRPEEYKTTGGKSKPGGYETKEIYYKPEGFETVGEDFKPGGYERSEEKSKPRDTWEFSKPLEKRLLGEYDSLGDFNPSVYKGKNGGYESDGYEKTNWEYKPGGYAKQINLNEKESNLKQKFIIHQKDILAQEYMEEQIKHTDQEENKGQNDNLTQEYMKKQKDKFIPSREMTVR